MHKFWTLLLLLLVPTILFAQKTRTVKGQVCTVTENKDGKEPLPYASVVILTSKDSTFVKGAASDANGHFNLQFIPQKGTEYLLKTSYTGMQSVFHKLDDQSSTINFGSILLKEGIELGEVTVKGQIREMDQVGDGYQCHSLQNSGRLIPRSTRETYPRNGIRQRNQNAEIQRTTHQRNQREW